MLKRKRNFWIVCIILYLFTGIGGWYSHKKELASRSQYFWNEAAKHDEMAKKQAELQGIHDPPLINRISSGPSMQVKWCFPILPGFLITNSSYQIAPLWGEGGVKLVFYYGFGSVEMVTLVGWMS
jgi:hypothetical protein